MTFLGAESMNPVALQIGTLIGLFIKEKDGYLFNNKWFNNPWDYISAIPSNPQMLELLTTLMTSAEGNAVGVSRTMLNRTWYPILNPLAGDGNNDTPTGIYIVATKPVDGVPTELGIGSLYEWKYESFSILPYAYFPILKLPATKSGSFAFILGQDGHPVETGINITGSNGVFNTGNGLASLSFDGFQAASEIYFKEGKYPSLNLTFLNLKLPGEKQGSNRSLFDLIYNASVQQSITVALSVLGSQLSQLEGGAATAGKMINSILELLGLLGPVPGIDWEALVKDPSAAARVFTLWLQNIGNDNAILKEWLNDWYCLFNGIEAGDKMYVTGDGTRAKPFNVKLLSAKFADTMSVNFAFTFAALKTPAGILQLFPGFNIGTSPILPIASMPEFGITVSAEVEVLRYDINTQNGGAASITLFPGYSIMATAANTVPGKPLFAVADLVRTGGVADDPNPPGLSLGSMNIGFVYDKDTATSAVPSPNFRLYEVQTAIGAWPLIDLSNFNVEALEQAIAPAVSAAIKAFFGNDKYALAFTAVLGIDPPSSYQGEWPLKNKMLLSPEELPLLIKNPFAAIGAYYSRCLTTKDANDKPLFEYLVPDYSTLLGSESTTVVGKGTEKDPWQIQLFKVGTADIKLAMWNPDTDLLAMAFDFSIPLPFSAVTAVFNLRAAIMVMQLPGNQGQGTWNAAWMQAVTGKLAIRSSKDEKLQTPSLGGVSIAATDVYVQGGWKNTGSFFVVAGIDELQMNSSAGVVQLGNIEFSTVGWGVEQLKQFAPAIVNGLGLLMLENGGTIGVLITTTLGMLPNLNKIFDGHEHPEYKFPIPEYFILPEGWPIFTLIDFANPWNDVHEQLSSLFRNGDFMNPLMQLVGWGLTGILPGAPDIIPIGTLGDPWSVTIPEAWNIELLAWVQDGQAGVGVQKQLAVSASENVEIASVIRLDVPTFYVLPQKVHLNLPDNRRVLMGRAIFEADNHPSLSFVNHIQNPDIPAPLIDAGGLVIDKVQFGFFVQLINGELALIPIFRFLHSRLKDTEVFRDIELIPVPGKPQFTSNDAMDAFNSLVNAMMDKLSDTIQKEGFKQLQAFLDVLQLYNMLDVMIDEDTKAKTYSFNPGGWASLLANPGGYLFQRTKEILQTGQLCADLIKAVAQLVGREDFKLPAVWQGLQYLLQSLDLVKEYSGYFIPQFNAWLALFNRPIEYLSASVSKLFNSPDLIKELVTNISKLISLSKDENDLRKFFSVDTSGYIITITIPTDKIISIGDELRLFFDMVIDVNALTITNSLALGTNTLDSALAFQWTPAYKDGKLTNDFGFYLITLPGSPQAFAPLQLWPFPEDKQKYIQQIGYQVPMTLLSSFSVKYLNDYVAPQNPAVNNIFKVLGLTSTVEGKELIRPLTGIFMNPVGWLLSPEVLGNGSGSVDLTKLGHLLYAVTGAVVIKNGDIELKGYEHEGKKDGVQLTGLPWGVSFYVFANTEEGANLGGAFSPTLPSPAPQIKLTGGIGFGTPNGVAVSGSIDMSYNLGKGSTGTTDNTLGIKAAYAKRAFTLTAYANSNEYALLPFGGLNQFLNEGIAGVLLTIIGDKLFAAYHDYVIKNPTTPLKTFVESIETVTGITDGTKLFNFFDAIYKDPLGQFTEANIVKTLPNINKFVTQILTLKGFKVTDDNKLLIYEHTFESLPGAKVVMKIGLDTIGGKNVFGIWLEPVATFSWIAFGLNKTGVGVVMPVDYQNPQIQYEVNIAVGANFTSFGIPNSPEPVLTFGLSGNLASLNGPNLKFYPVKVSNDTGTLLIELLPNPQLQIVGRQNVTTEQWMINFGVDFLVPFAANMALGVTAIKNWLNTAKIGNVTGIPGKVLVDWGLLVKETDKYYLANLKTAFNLNDPIGIVTKLIFSALNLLDGQLVVPIKGHGIYVQSEKKGDQTRYGLRIQITDIEVGSSQDKDGSKLTFQLGKYYGSQDKDNNWTGLKSEPGVVVYFINRNTVSNSMSFMPKFELISIGLDFGGANAQSPLINTKGVTIQKIEPRVYVSLDFDGSITTDFGAGVMLYSIGVPLGPGFDNQGANSNPVAQNLLSSGGDKGKTDAINPSFSVSTSYVYNSGEFNLQLYDAQGMPTSKVWISIMRAFGPLQCRKVGIGWKSDNQEKRLDFLFDGQVSLAGLMANLVELDIGIPVSDPTDFSKYSLDLAGLDVSYNAGSVTIGGGFLKDDSEGYVQYTGQAVIQTSGFGIGAFGSYALIDKHPSLFIFAYLNAPLGGPPFFFVNGLSGGFGYNRTINIPPANQIENFPFVAGIENPVALGGKDGQPPSAEEALRALGTKIVPPQLGSYWVAAGIMFSSFQLINSKAVLMVIFGNDFEIALLGLSGMVLPKKGKTYVGAQIAFKVTYKMSTGLLAMEAVLTSNSYVIDPNCKLTGGLAFYVWFKDQSSTGARAGEFVFTLGGYNPAFKKPDYFPDEPRLGFSWSLGDVTIKGGAYFALTPSAVMAGGSLEAVYKSGNLKAWFTAYADFLIMWNPFYYDIRVGVSVGASYTVKFIWTTTFKVELGADVHIWGPAMAGSATVHWWVISFTVRFGATSSGPNDSRIIDWNEFNPYFLPKDQAPAAPPQQQPETALLRKSNAGVKTAAQDAVPVQQVSHIKQSAGLIKELPNPNADVSKVSPSLWQITADGFAFNVSTIVPLNSITINGIAQPITSDVKFGIRPMGSVVFGKPGQMSTLDFKLYYNTDEYKDLKNWAFAAELNGVPESLWGTVNNGKTAVDSKIIPGALVGLSAKVISAEDNLPKGGPPMFPLSNLGYAAWAWRKLTLADNPQLHPASPAIQTTTSLRVIEDTVMKDDVVKVRTAVLNAVVSAGINVLTDGRLDQMAAYAISTFQSFPMLGELGSLGYQKILTAADTRTFKRAAPAQLRSEPIIPVPVTTKAVIVQYARPELPTPVFMAASLTDIKRVRPVKGMMYHDDIKNHLLFSAAKQGSRLRSASDDNKQEHELYPGVSVIMDVDPYGPAATIEFNGELPLFASWFDEHNQLIGSELLQANKQLPEGVCSIILIGINTEILQLPYAYGWHTTSQLTLVNPNALIGTGVIVIPDSPIRIDSHGTSHSYGLITGEKMAENNRIVRDEKSVQAGIKTIMRSELRTIAVLAEKKQDADFDSSTIEVEVRIDNAGIPEYRKLQASAVINGLNEAAVLFDIPSGTGHSYNTVYAQPLGNAFITGVFGLQESVQEVEQQWEQIVLQPAIPYPYVMPQKHTLITISQA